MKTQNTDVLIVGAGPSGLMLACELILHKIDFIIIDKALEKPRNSGALVIHAASMEIFETLGILNKVLLNATAVNKAILKTESEKGLSFDFTDLVVKGNPYPSIILLEQYKLEEILKDYIISAGHHILIETAISSIKVDEEIINSIIIHTSSSEALIKSRYIIGADGKNSKVRELMAIPYTKYRHQVPIFIIDYEGEAPSIPGEIYFSFTKKGSFGFFSLKNGRFRLDGSLPELELNEGKISLDEIKKNLPAEVKINTVKWFSVFYGNYLLCNTFSSHNVFLIGDAAHTHNPVGGQGMNSGFQDAHNLSWKLLYVIRGLAHPDILKTYTSERKPIVKKIMKWSNVFFRFTSDFSKVGLILRLKVFPLLFGFLTFVFQSQYFKSKIYYGISQLWINYRSSLISRTNKNVYYKTGMLFRQDSLPFPIKHTSNYKLLIFSKVPLETNHPALRPFPLDIIVVIESFDNASIFKKLRIKKSISILIRPDNYIAMISKKHKIRKIVSYFKSLSK